MHRLLAKIVWVFLAVNSVTMLVAAEPIKGMFGFELGRVPDTDRVLKISSDSKGIYTYHVKPETPDPVFNDYSVKITPEGHQVFKILAGGDFESKDAALKGMKSFLEKLATKHGPSVSLTDAAVIESGDRLIMLQVAELKNKRGYLMMSCSDRKLEKLAETESMPNKTTTESPAATSSEFDGAFGFRFGDTFNPADALGVRKAKMGTQYVVKAPKPNSAFGEYLLFITPKTHRISSIWARAEFPDLTEAKKKQTELLAVLTGKYGAINEKASDDKTKAIFLKNGFISVAVAELPGKEGVVQIIYHNLFYSKQRETEENEAVARPRRTSRGFKSDAG